MKKKLKKSIEIKNKKLCKCYPFLIIRNYRTNKPIGYDFTYFDDIPKGWQKAFGIQMCEDIRKILVKANYLYDYRIAQIKEKFGGLRWYDYGAPSSIYQELQETINKYGELSYHTCINCGRPATKISLGWISPFCDKCADKIGEKVKFKNLEED